MLCHADRDGHAAQRDDADGEDDGHERQYAAKRRGLPDLPAQSRPRLAVDGRLERGLPDRFKRVCWRRRGHDQGSSFTAAFALVMGPSKHSAAESARLSFSGIGSCCHVRIARPKHLAHSQVRLYSEAGQLQRAGSQVPTSRRGDRHSKPRKKNSLIGSQLSRYYRPRRYEIVSHAFTRQRPRQLHRWGPGPASPHSASCARSSSRYGRA